MRNWIDTTIKSPPPTSTPSSAIQNIQNKMTFLVTSSLVDNLRFVEVSIRSNLVSLTMGKDIEMREIFEPCRAADVDIVDVSRILGSVHGSEEKCESFLATTSQKFSNLLQKLGKFVKTSAQNAYSYSTRDVQ